MTEYEKYEIARLRREGMSANKIAQTLNLPMNRVRSHIRRHPVDSAAKKCLQCRKPLTQVPHRKERKFCSDKCRMLWWNSHPELVKRKAYYDKVCPWCHTAYQSYGKKNRIYCSRKCYADARRKEVLRLE